MKPIKMTLLCAALALAFGLPALAAGEEVAAKKPRATTRESRAARPEVTPDIKDYSELSGQVIYQVLLAEMALQRGKTEFASQAYADLAVRTRDPAILQRAIEVAGHARRLDLVLELARLWVEVEPDSQRAQQVLIGVLVMSNQLDGLAPQLIRMLEADKEALPANLLALNRMFARSPDRQAVLRLISQVCKAFFGLAEAHYAVAVAASAADQQEQALAEARQALEQRPEWEAAALLEAQILGTKSPAKAIKSLQRFLERNPGARDAQLQLARVLVAEKRYSEARRLFEELLLAYPNNPDVVFPVAILALQENDTALAEKQLKHLVTLDFQQKSAPYYYLGQIAEGGKRSDDALAYYQQVGPGEYYLPAQVRSAAIRSRSGKLDEARKQLRAAADKSPELGVQLSIAEAALLRDAKETEAALELLEQELGKQPEQPELLYESALLAEKLGRVELMESRLRKLIELQPDSAQAYNALGYSYADRNTRLPEARQLIEKALQLAPNDPFILDSMGWVLYRQGDLEGALGYLQRAHSQRADPEIAAHIGEVLWMLGRKEEARLTLREAQKKDPSNEVLTEAIKRFAP
ncbi:tetratricopeptide repeat protein [Accumulibacter sp.]|uniref:tetratricopeptide repeat protein n=1 Tax=Accumulibacter sp. TaxID=2053492 RepID=UPI001A5CE01E|nr:tetratricopeptide repeat protein [Accumulibacter sp.]MBL8373909.1 tetratricopeptide repeat protein [Accumulibacter sp.]